MLVIPAIDLKDGKCVRLRQGRFDDVTVFSDDPVAVAGRWVKAGARRLHLVDLDGALEGQPANAEVIRKITQTYPELPVQIGGGIRSMETVKAYLDAGVSYAIIGTWAVTSPDSVAALCDEFTGNIIIGLDAKKGKVATDGWEKVSSLNAIDLATHYENMGVAAIVYTDIARDGMMRGVNTRETLALAQSVNIPIIASGGVTNIEDIRALGAIASEGILGVIAGRALYEGTLSLQDAQSLADQFI